MAMNYLVGLHHFIYMIYMLHFFSGQYSLFSIIHTRRCPVDTQTRPSPFANRGFLPRFTQRFCALRITGKNSSWVWNKTWSKRYEGAEQTQHSACLEYWWICIFLFFCSKFELSHPASRGNSCRLCPFSEFLEFSIFNPVTFLQRRFLNKTKTQTWLITDIIIEFTSSS